MNKNRNDDNTPSVDGSGTTSEIAAQDVAPAPIDETPRARMLSTSDSSELPRLFAPRITVSDLSQSVGFYRDGLGAMQIVTTHEHERIVRFASGPDLVLLQGARRNVAPRVSEGPAGLILEVSDINTAVEHAVAAGGSERPYDPGKGAQSNGIRVAAIHDPDGVLIVLIQYPQMD